jgi:hypothetical protein
MELRKAIVDPKVFDAICAKLPGLAPWIDPAKAQGVSRVFGMGDLHSRWRTMSKDSRAAILGFFPVGDSLVRTNPLYGRGCSFAAVSAHLLRDAITASADPARASCSTNRRPTGTCVPTMKSCGTPTVTPYDAPSAR